MKDKGFLSSSCFIPLELIYLMLAASQPTGAADGRPAETPLVFSAPCPSSGVSVLSPWPGKPQVGSR